MNDDSAISGKQTGSLYFFLGSGNKRNAKNTAQYLVFTINAYGFHCI